MTEFERAMDLLKDGTESFIAAINIFESLGLNVNNIAVYNWSRQYAEVLLTKGINKVSNASGTPIEAWGENFGKVVTNGITFHQEKLPVEHQEWYA